MQMDAADLSLADLVTFDPYAREPVGAWRRFLCPFCGDGKPRDNTHRTCCFNVETGRWTCKRCDQGGYVREFREKRAQERERSPRRKARPRSVSPPPPAPPDPEKLTALQAALRQGQGLQRLDGTPGADYLTGRGIPLETARAAGVKYHGAWFGKAAVVFPIRNPAGELVAAEGRYIQVGPKDPKTRCAGEKRLGAFATAGAWAADPVGVCEGPCDALTLAAAGLPTLAVMGKKLPPCLAPRMMRRCVFLASDADEKGEEAAAEWGIELRSYGATTERADPVRKDWNALLMECGPEEVAALVRVYLAALGPFPEE